MDKLLLTICLTLLATPNGILSQSCRFNKELVNGQEYYISSPEYPEHYRHKTDCVWYLRTAVGSRVYLSCDDLELPSESTQICGGNKLSVAANGDKEFIGAKEHCGIKTFSLLSKETKMALRLQTTFNTPGAKLLCVATTVKTNTLESSNNTNGNRGICDCGWKPRQRIVGGVETGLNEFPYMAALIVSKRFRCGSTIISDRFALTSAQCVYDKNYTYYKLVVGGHHLSTVLTSASYSIQNCGIHPNYNPKTYKNDIAILLTLTQILFSPYVGPCCLPFRHTYDSFAGQPVDVIGWLHTVFSGITSNTLQKAQLKIVSRDTCESMLSERILDGDICTFDEDKDTCQYDSGGPILWFDTTIQRYQVIGITSHSVGCAAGLPAIGTRVSEYLQWIINSTRVNYCVK